MPVTPDDDPGWRLHPGMFVPGLGALTMRMRRGGDGLVGVRGLFVAMVVPLGWLFVVLHLLPSSDVRDPPPSTVVAVGLLVLGGVAAVATPKLGSLVCERLAPSYRSRLFVRLALAEGVALAGFVATFVAGQRWLYLVGVLAAAPAYRAAAPTRRNLADDQMALRASGCERNLVAELRAA